MLFLAVFCGFIAEYLLEHKIEKEKGREYVRMYYEDLKADTANFSDLLFIYKNKMSKLEKRYDCYQNIIKDMSATECLWDLIDNSSSFPDLVYTDRTIQQLKNAGGLRLLKQADADSILFYDNNLRQYKQAETTSFQETQTGIRNTIFSLLNYQKLSEKDGNKPKDTHSLLLPGTNELLNRYFNQLDFYARTCKSIYQVITYLRSQATSLISYFKNEYHLK